MSRHMRQVRGSLLALLLLLLGAPLAAAGIDVAIGPARIEVVDDRADECFVRKVCPVDVTGAPGKTTVDTEQRIEHATVTTDFGELRAAAGGFWLLPDQSVAIEREDLYVDRPRQSPYVVFNLLPLGPQNPVWFEGRQTSFSMYCKEHGLPASRKCVDEEEGYRLAVLDTGKDNDTTGAGGNEWRFYFYDIYPIPSSDYYGWYTHKEARNYGCQGASFCHDTLNVSSAAYNATAPDVQTGFRMKHAQLATDPSLLIDLDALPLRASSAAPVRQGQATAPPSTVALERAPPTLSDDAPEGAPEPASPAPAPQARSADLVVSRSSSLDVVEPAAPRWAYVVAGTAAGLLLLALAVALYSRFNNREDALRNATRGRILAIVRSEPGLILSEVAARIGLTRNGVAHHAQVLAGMGLVRLERRESRVHLFPGEPPSPEWERATLARLLGDDPVLSLLRHEPGLTRREIHARLAHIPLRTRNHRLRRLSELGAIAKREADGEARYFPAFD